MIFSVSTLHMYRTVFQELVGRNIYTKHPGFAGKTTASCTIFPSSNTLKIIEVLSINPTWQGKLPQL